MLDRNLEKSHHRGEPPLGWRRRDYHFYWDDRGIRSEEKPMGPHTAGAENPPVPLHHRGLYGICSSARKGQQLSYPEYDEWGTWPSLHEPVYHLQHSSITFRRCRVSSDEETPAHYFKLGKVELIIKWVFSAGCRGAQSHITRSQCACVLGMEFIAIKWPGMANCMHFVH